MVKDLTAVCSKGGFQLSKWMSNSRKVLASIPEERLSKATKDLNLDKDNLPVERTLGLHWCVESDAFMFKIAISERPHTRRGILSVISSIYDPLGFLSPLLLPSKLLLQELCRRNIGWDNEMPQSLLCQWSEWLQDLNKVAMVKVDRCIKPKEFGKIELAQLHHFSDASECGYGTVSYLRLEDENKEVRLSFMLGKSRVAPLKQITIPRLELAAAVLAVKIDKMLKKELQLDLAKSVFWTDSQTVLKYIANDAKRFHTFDKTNRVSVIRDATDVVQWRHIGTKLNPADDASRGMSIEHFLKANRWIQGPDFLLDVPEKWPHSYIDRGLKDDPEVKKDTVVVAAISKCSDSATHQLLNSFSDWRKLKTAVAWVLKFKEVLLKLKQHRKFIPVLIYFWD
ncbi:uncharacterized protein LOC125266160 [Megalobrama amblycephala]|uniref:uncharacterized protein LOC125266160 n=1 Tax=Megalobrama amblycephala TaxID=75352 RepID=UPI002014622A|nr:uncharacterized protein LOC125266160 [Megalobrama amblycephala]